MKVLTADIERDGDQWVLILLVLVGPGAAVERRLRHPSRDALADARDLAYDLTGGNPWVR